MNIQLDPSALQRLMDERVHRILYAGLSVLKTATKEILSVPAPRVRVVSKGGVAYWRATTPATPGAPPRKLSGVLRQRVTSSIDVKTRTGRYGTYTPYAARLEAQAHRYLTVVLEQRGQDAFAAMRKAAEQ